jgi:hypothetical protein
VASFKEKMKKIFLILVILNLKIYSYSQNIHLSDTHNPINKTITYIVDYLSVDSVIFFSIGLKKSDIKKIKIDILKNTIFVNTELAIVLNGELLLTKKDKKVKLSIINLHDLESVKKIEKKKCTKLYGKKGALIIKTKH